jgi:predicted RNA binding protein YcfA (HicA-like mRNA interferase family)
MGYPKNIWNQLKNISTDRFIKALLDNGFVLDEVVRTERCYRNQKGNKVTIHYHTGNATFGKGLIQSLLEDAGWTEKDFKRLKLVK